MILAGDVGGTKTDLALYAAEKKELTKIAQERFSSPDHTSLKEVIGIFLSRHPRASIQKAAFGIAGPVLEGRCRTTNLPWEIDEKALRSMLGTDRVKLLNDMEATAYGMLHLPETSYVSLNPAGSPKEGNRAVIAAGTGLGEALLYYDGTHFHPIATEGGHCDFAPLSERQTKLLEWLRNEYGDHISYERILSGSGIDALYRFLVSIGFGPQPSFMEALPKNTDKSAQISRGALEYDDPLCKETLRLFCEIYGAEAGNLALKSLSVGGIYIGGGIAPKILPVLQEGKFAERFFAKGRFENLLKKMPLLVCLDSHAALLGAVHYAAWRL